MSKKKKEEVTVDVQSDITEEVVVEGLDDIGEFDASELLAELEKPVEIQEVKEEKKDALTIVSSMKGIGNPVEDRALIELVLMLVKRHGV